MGVKGDAAAGSQVVDNFELIPNLLLAIRPWTMTHEQLSDQEEIDSESLAMTKTRV